MLSPDDAEDAGDGAGEAHGDGDCSPGQPRAPGQLLRGLQLTTSASNRGKQVKINVFLNCQNFVSFTSFVFCGLLTDLKFNGVNKNSLL